MRSAGQFAEQLLPTQ